MYAPNEVEGQGGRGEVGNYAVTLQKSASGQGLGDREGRIGSPLGVEALFKAPIRQGEA